MYDEQKTMADRVDQAMSEVNNCALDILDKTDGSGGSVIEGFDDDIMLFRLFTDCGESLNRETNKFTDGVYNVLQTNSKNKGGLTSYGLRINGINPLFGISHNYTGDSTASKLVSLMNTLQRNKSDLLVGLVNDAYNYNVAVLKNLINVVLNRKVLGKKLGVYADVSKIVEKKASSVNLYDVGRDAVATSAALGGLRTYEVIGSSGNVLATFGGGSGVASTELAVVGGSGTELALAGSTELATVGSTELAATSTVGTTASGSLFASVASVAIPAIIGTAVITGGLTAAVIIETRKRIKKFAAAVDNYNNLMKEFVDSFYCNSINYPTLTYDDSNPEGPIVFRSDAVTSTSSQLALSIMDTNVERAVTRFGGHLNGYDAKMMYDKVYRFLRNGNGLVTYEDVINCINRFLENVKTIVKQFTLVENQLNTDIDSIASEVVRGNWGNGQKRKTKLEAAGYNYDEIQSRVNELLSSKAYSNIGKAIVTTGVVTNKIVNKDTSDEDTKAIITDSTNNTVIDDKDKDKKPSYDKKDKDKKPVDGKKDEDKKPDDDKKDEDKKPDDNKKDEDKKPDDDKKDEDKKPDDDKKDEFIKPAPDDKVTPGNNNDNKVKPLVNNNSNNSNTSNISNQETSTNSDISSDKNEILQDDSITDSKISKDEVITTTTINKVKQTDSKSAGKVVPVILGVGAAGALAAAGARYIKNKKEDQYYLDDENYFSNEEEISEDSESEDENKQIPKYKSGSVNELVLDDVDDVKISNSDTLNDSDTLDFE